jgi:predicted short-subunit dehydrogenase-like oxidoreductase (DUF2520 family)
VTRKPRIAIVGAGRLASSLAVALRESGYIISEIVSRDTSSSRRRARALARKVDARAATLRKALLDAEVLWFCVPDREIRRAAQSLAKTEKGSPRYVIHSSGALLGKELAALRKQGASVASVHPLMTFVAGSRPSLTGVPFALEGDSSALRAARRIVQHLGGEAFLLRASRKSAYHAWATFTSPLWLAFLVTLEESARAAGLTRKAARRMSLPILRQTLENYVRLGPEHSFSGPIIRGDVETVAKHLAVLQGQPRVRDVYTALAQVALEKLPTKKRKELQRLLRA